jgi:hypothetical protein
MLIPDGHATMAIGYLAAAIYHAAKEAATDPDEWLPTPPEWIELWNKALLETLHDYRKAYGEG